MESNARRQKRREIILSSLDVAIETLNLAKELASITPAKAVFSSVSVILTMIKDSMDNDEEYVELGLACAGVCTALDRGLNGRLLSELDGSVCEAINQLTTTVAEIRRKIMEQTGRNAASRIFHAKSDKGTIAAWRSDLDRILHVFNTELAINTNVAISDVRRGVVTTQVIVSDVQQGVTNTHAIVSELQQSVSGAQTMLSDIHTMVKNQGGTDGNNRPAQTSSSGESPPPPPRAFFGRDELIEEIVDLAGNLTPLALIGTGGIGKTSIALTVLHDSRIKQRFGNDRRFIRCDQFSASLTHFLSRLSKVIGAGVQNPEDLTPLRPFLSSKEMIIVLDNAESILDPQLPDAEEIHSVVEELSQLSNICLCITSRISTIPPDCETLDIPTLSMEAARDTFYRIHRNAKRSDLINDILERLDFHPLSITLLSTAAHHNKWDTNRLSKEWEKRRTGVLQTHHHKSLAATIELSLTSPMFQELGADGRELLGVIAFFPQGIDEDNLEWLFPTISDPTNVFDNFCILSLTYRSNGFVTMLAPLRDHLCPKDPNSSPLLCATKDLYVRRLSDYADPDWPSFEETRWIASEDVNVEHLLNVFTSIDKNSDGIWSACTHFMDLLYWHKPRLVVLGPRIEALPDSHPSKPQCLLALSSLFGAVRNLVESKRLLAHALKLWRGQGNDLQVARTLKHQAYANLWLHLHAEGIPQAKEASEIYERLNRTVGQTSSLRCLAFLLAEDGQADAAEEALSRATNLSSGKPNESDLCEHNHILGHISLARGEMDAAITHHQKAHGIAASLDSRESLSLITRCLVHLLLKEGRFDDAAAHLEFLESDVDNDIVSLGLAALVQACVWRRQGRVEEAEAELSRVIGLYRKMGVSSDFMERCNAFRRQIEEKMNSQVNSTGSGGGES